MRKWLIGDANRHDEQALDASAQDDAFLSDALEGYRSLPGADHAADVTRLKARLRKQSERRRGAVFYLLRIAAVGAVLVATWVVLQQFQSSEKSAAVADKISTEAQSASAETSSAMADSVDGGIAQQEKPSAPADEDAVAYQPEVSQKRKTESPRANTSSSNLSLNYSYDTNTAPATESAAPPPVTLMDSRPPLPTQSDEVVAMEENKEADTSRKTDTSAKPEPSRSKAKKMLPPSAGKSATPTNLRKITGKVTDNSHEPLIGVNILAKGTSTGTVTDIDGKYSIEVPTDKDVLIFNYTGYSSMEVSAGNSNELNVTLNENDVALSEVVVTGYGQMSSDPPPVESPRPVGGFKAFKKYVADNLRHPEADKQPRPREVVRVRFTLQANGKLTNLTPKGNAPQVYKDEAMRLLREGPNWNGTPGTTAVYRFVFE
ncbi:MAG: hypothetical protein GC192_23345 [Bacteroidetes bacterium]|nr:hypothetical protein [Bacteroidota bacterium]